MTQQRQQDAELYPQDAETELRALAITLQDIVYAKIACQTLRQSSFYRRVHQHFFRAACTIANDAKPEAAIGPELATLVIKREGTVPTQELEQVEAYEQVIRSTQEGLFEHRIDGELQQYTAHLIELEVKRAVIEAGRKAQEQAQLPGSDTLAIVRDLGTDLDDANERLRQARGESRQAMPSCLGTELVRGELVEMLPGYFAKGYVHIHGGDNESGKTITAMMISAGAAHIVAFPGMDSKEEHPLPPMRTLWVDTEGMTGEVRERALRWGLDRWLEHVHFLGEGGIAQVDFTQEGVIEDIGYTAKQRECDLVVVDSLAGAHSGRENDASLRVIMQRAVRTAAEYNQIWVLTQFTRKPDQTFAHKPRPTTADLRGSSVISQFARVVILNHRPAQTKDAFEIFVDKRTFGAKPEPVGMYVTDESVTFGEVPTGPVRVPKVSKADKAAKWLESRLQFGPQKAKDMYTEGEEQGYEERIMKQAYRKLQIEPEQEYDQAAGRSWWMWELPEYTNPQLNIDEEAGGSEYTQNTKG